MTAIKSENKKIKFIDSKIKDKFNTININDNSWELNFKNLLSFIDLNIFNELNNENLRLNEDSHAYKAGHVLLKDFITSTKEDCGLEIEITEWKDIVRAYRLHLSIGVETSSYKELLSNYDEIVKEFSVQPKDQKEFNIYSRKLEIKKYLNNEEELNKKIKNLKEENLKVLNSFNQESYKNENLSNNIIALENKVINLENEIKSLQNKYLSDIEYLKENHSNELIAKDLYYNNKLIEEKELLELSLKMAFDKTLLEETGTLKSEINELKEKLKNSVSIEDYNKIKSLNEEISISYEKNKKELEESIDNNNKFHSKMNLLMENINSQSSIIESLNLQIKHYQELSFMDNNDEGLLNRVKELENMLIKAKEKHDDMNLTMLKMKEKIIHQHEKLNKFNLVIKKLRRTKVNNDISLKSKNEINNKNKIIFLMSTILTISMIIHII